MEKTLGILMLDTKFPRIPGDVGNPKTFDYPIRKLIVEGANPQSVVMKADPNLLEPFIRAARQLEAEGVTAITTSCGFLAMFQKEVAAAVNIPVFCSSLLQGGFIADQLPAGKVLGILTANSEKLTERHFKGVGLDRVDKVIYGMQGTHFYHIFVARNMVAEHPNVGAIVLECTNMPPYAKAINEATGLPVYDITTLANYVMDGAARKPI